MTDDFDRRRGSTTATKTGTLIEPDAEITAAAIRELARDSMPILLPWTVEVEREWTEDGHTRFRITGEKDPIYHEDARGD